MITNFEIEIGGVKFLFNTMNRVRLQLYQVYAYHEGKKHRFHMEVEGDGEFKIKDKTACPQPYLAYEQELGGAILEKGQLPTA